jgi:hypothetical protein
MGRSARGTRAGWGERRYYSMFAPDARSVPPTPATPEGVAVPPHEGEG